MSAYTHTGTVYFVAVGRYVKIGYTSAPVERRMAHLTSGARIICPEDIDWAWPLELVHTIPGCVMRDERRIHDLFAAYRVAGEWFAFDRPLIEHLSALQYVTYKQNLLDFRRARAELKRRPSLAAAA